MPGAAVSVCLLFLLSVCSACYISNCPIGGKRSIMDAPQRKVSQKFHFLFVYCQNQMISDDHIYTSSLITIGFNKEQLIKQCKGVEKQQNNMQHLYKSIHILYIKCIEYQMSEYLISKSAFESLQCTIGFNSRTNSLIDYGIN